MKVAVRLLYSCFCLSFLSGCSPTANLKPDDYMSPLAANYHSAEIQVDHTLYYGVASVGVRKGTPFYFKVGGLYRGHVHVQSKECGIDETKSVEEFDSVEFIVPVERSERCLLSIFVTPAFTADESNKVQWRPVSGYLVLRTDDRPLFLKEKQLKVSDTFIANFQFEEPTRLVLNGCEFHHNLPNLKGPVKFVVHFSPKIADSVCVFDGFIKSEKSNITLSFLVTRFHKDFLKLPIPKIEIQNRRVKVEADSTVSVMNFQGRTIFSSQGVFDYDGEYGILRLYTAAGRTVYCEIDMGVAKCFH